jgi:hypothetical protein
VRSVRWGFRGRAVLVVGAVCAPLLAGCSSGSPSSAPSPLGTTPAASSTATSTATSTLVDARPAVEDALNRYDGVETAYLGGGAFTWTAVRSVAVDPWATTWARRMAQTRALGITVGGKAVRRVQDVTVTGSTATALRCVDLSATVLNQKGKAGKGRGAGPEKVRYDLKQVGGRWRVSALSLQGAC